MAFTKQPYVFINEAISQTGTIPAANLSLLITSRRGTVNANTLGQLNFDLYKPFVIPGQYLSSGLSALNYLKSQGATVNLGISNSINLVAPNTVTVSGSQVTLTWTAEPIGWTDLLAGSISGTVLQKTSLATGTILTISRSAFSIVLTNITGTFNTTNIITVTYVNNSVAIPDGKQTEIFALDVYYAVQAMRLTNTLNLTFGTPSLSISIVSDQDATYNPTATPFSLGVPDFVVINPDTTVSLFWNTAPANWIYVPQTALGASTMTQATSLATGTIVEQLPATYSPSAEGVGILLTNVTGTFNTTDAISMTLDDTVSVFSFLGDNYYKFVQTTYEIDDNTDFNTTYAEFKNYINSVNAMQSSSDSQFGTFGVIAVSSVPYSNYTSTAQPNSNQFVYTNYYYPNRIGDIYIQAGQVAASLAGALACNLVPYNPMFSVNLNGLPVSGDNTTYLNTTLPGGQAEQLLEWGQTPIAVNQSTGVAYIVNPVTTEITIPNSDVIDQEFYDLGTWQVVNELKLRAYAAVQSPQFLNTRITPKLLQELNNAIYTMLKQAEFETMIFNVDALKQFITVVLDPVNPHAVDISFEIQISPAFTGTTININIVSALIPAPTTQA